MSLEQVTAGWNWSAVLGWAAAVLGPLLMWIASRRKADIDESALILQKWKEIVDAHESAIKRLTEDFERERKRWSDENAALRHRVTEVETENRALRDEVAGLKRAIAQNSKSTAYQLGGRGRRNSDPSETFE